MDLVAVSIKTKGVRNFTRRIWTVFTRFGVTEGAARRQLQTMVRTVKLHGGRPTLFIPAAVLSRHPALIGEIVQSGAEIGIHGYVHNDYRTLTAQQQDEQTAKAISTFVSTRIPYHGFRNPYLGWNEDSLQVFTRLGLTYDSNEAVLHDVVDLDPLSPSIRAGFEKSLELFQAIPCTAYALRPRFEGGLLRIPTSIPDDEMLYDRLRITNNQALGTIWSKVLTRVYALEGIYVLNLHPERAVLCRPALEMLLATAQSQPLGIWLTNLDEVATWWQERGTFQVEITAAGDGRWEIEAACTPRATVLVRHVECEDAAPSQWYASDQRIETRRFVVRAARRPCIGLSEQTSPQVEEMLKEQGYAYQRAPRAESEGYALYLDMPAGLGHTRVEQMRCGSALLARLVAIEAPLVRFGCWPNGCRAALSITGDIDSITIQDFFLRILETRQYAN